MRVAVITNPRMGVFRIYYNQATPKRLHHLSLVNWWSGKLYRSPALPSANLVYKNFQGRVFDVPVLNAPPWHFVKYNNNSVEVTGGRDDKLLFLIAKRLNFRYQYYDPPDRSQGSSISGNASSKEPSSTHKARMVSVLISLGATYVIGDMYSANLTSLLARPAREQPIGTLAALEEAMRERNYELVVERHSSSLTILEV
ncbi:unnamed protein product, partial [Iphiclides podalirius]